MPISEYGVVKVCVHEPQDCMILRRPITEPLQGIIHIEVCNAFTRQMYGTSQVQSTEVWCKALGHVLETFHPHELTVRTDDRSWVDWCKMMFLSDKTTYYIDQEDEGTVHFLKG